MSEEKVPFKKLIPISIHLEKQKFLPMPTREEGCSDAYFLEKGEKLGLDLSLQETKVLFAVQKLIDWALNDSMNPNWREFSAKESGLGVQCTVPVIYLKKAQLYQAYGLKKRQTKRGSFEYSSNQCYQVWKSFYNLIKNSFLVRYTRKTVKNKTVCSEHIIDEQTFLLDFKEEF